MVCWAASLPSAPIDAAKANLGLDRLNIKHLVRLAEAVALVEPLALLGRVQGNDADLSAACFGEGHLYKMAGQLTATVLRLDVNIGQVAALRRAGIERMRRPGEEQQARPSDNGVSIGGEPAEVFSLVDHFCDPGSKWCAITPRTWLSARPASTNMRRR